MICMEKKTSICDGLIPVMAVVDRYVPYVPPRLDCHPDDAAPAEGPDLEWHLETTKGFNWPGLLDLASPFELADIHDDLLIMLESPDHNDDGGY